MRKWEGDDPGINNQKTPTILLLTPNKVLIFRKIHRILFAQLILTDK